MDAFTKLNKDDFKISLLSDAVLNVKERIERKKKQIRKR